MQLHQAKSGQIMPMVSLLMVVLVGMAAFAIDGSNIYSQHRRFQADLDVAVKVAASEMFDFDPSSLAYTSTVRTAIAAAATILAEDGYPNTLTISTSATIAPSGGGFCGTDTSAGITICNPPQSGLFAGAPHYDYVEGRLSRVVGGFFGGVLGLGQMRIGVRAVAWHGGYHQPYAIIGLDPSGCSISLQDSATTLNVEGSIIADGSTCNSGAASVSGHSDEVVPNTTNPIIGASGNNDGVPPIIDPYTPISVTATEPVTQAAATSIPPECATEAAYYIPSPVSGAVYFFPPADGSPGAIAGSTVAHGTYYFLPRCDGTTLGSPGVYYITGGIHVSGSASYNSWNTVFVFDSTGNPIIKDTGNTSWVLHAPIRGPYQGIAMSEGRPPDQPPCPSPGTNSLELRGNAANIIDGVVDAPCADISVSGNSPDPTFVNGVLVGWDVTVAGNALVGVNYDPSGTPPDKGSVLVE